MMGFGLSLDEKIEKAIANIRHYESEALKRDPENGYYLCDSYGKDSCVILDLAEKSGVKFKAHHNLTTLDPPELIQFGRKYHPDTIVHKPEVPMLKMLYIKNNGPPTRLLRWCCNLYKEANGNDFVKIFGIRAAESAKRKNNWRIWTPHKNSNSWVLNPILYWSDQNLWQYIHDNNIPYCSLYDEGCDRLGCIGCPMSGKKRFDAFARWPKYEQAWKRAVQKFWDKWHGVPTQKGEPRWFDKRGWTSWEQLWDWWINETGNDYKDDCQMGLF